MPSIPATRDIQYAAFLRGINVGGHRIIKMSELASMFERMGLRDVKTWLASGNVSFTSDNPSADEVTEVIELALAAELGYPLRVMVRSIEQLRALVEIEPFAGVEDPDTHRYVVFYPSLPE